MKNKRINIIFSVPTFSQNRDWMQNDFIARQEL